MSWEGGSQRSSQFQLSSCLGFYRLEHANTCLLKTKRNATRDFTCGHVTELTFHTDCLRTERSPECTCLTQLQLSWKLRRASSSSGLSSCGVGVGNILVFWDVDVKNKSLKTHCSALALPFLLTDWLQTETGSSLTQAGGNSLCLSLCLRLWKTP